MKRWTFLIVMCLLLALVSCDNGGDVDQTQISDVDQARIDVSIEGLHVLRGQFRQRRFSEYWLKFDDAIRRVSSLTTFDLDQSEIVLGFVAFNEDAVSMVVHWVSDEPKGKFIKVVSNHNSVTLPMRSLNIEYNAVDAAGTILFYAEVSVEKGDPEWSSVMEIIRGNEPFHLALLDERQDTLDQIEPVVVLPAEPDQRLILTIPPGEEGLLAALFAELPPELSPDKWDQNEPINIYAWFRENLIGRRVALQLEYDSVENRDEDIKVQLKMTHPKDAAGDDVGYVNGTKIYIVHVAIRSILLPFDADLYTALVQSAQNNDRPPTAVFEIERLSIFYNKKRGSWGFDVFLTNGEFLEPFDF